MDNNANLLEERHGEHAVHDFRHLGLLKLTPINPETYPPERLQKLWERIKTQDYAFDDFSRGDAVAFALSLTDRSSMHFEVDDRAYIVVKNLQVSDNPSIHYCVWDQKMQFREILQCGYEIVNFLFRNIKIARLSASIPTYNRQAIKFATLLGFKFEGELRNAILFHEKHYSVMMYGLLRSEWERVSTRYS